MSKNSITFYFVRHAQTCANENCQNGDANDALSDLGRIQTNLLGMHLANVKFDRVFSSDYARSIETTRGILRYSKGSGDVEIETRPELREINVGVFENRPYKDLMEYCINLRESIHEWSFPEGESFPEAGKRFLGFVENVWNNNTNDEATILVVSHSAILSCFITTLFQDPHHKIIGLAPEDRKIMNNTCYISMQVSSSLDGDGLNFKVLRAYYSKHLRCLQGSRTSSKMGRSNNPILDFANRNKDAQKFKNCVQQ